MSEKLAIVMPVYNEEEVIGTVLEKWVTALDALNIDYTINSYNDGSKDNSLSIIQQKANKFPGKVIAHDKPNSGHGPTILQGYREAVANGYDWIFQVDSDDEMGPECFAELWNKRNEFDFLVGIRDGRKQLFPRKVISAVSRLCVRLFYGKSIWDVNTPYRLMRVSALKEIYFQIPEDTFAPNVIISGMVADKKLRYYESKVPQRDRQTGEVSIKKWRLFKGATKSFYQTTAFSISHSNFFYPVSILFSTFCFTMMLGFNPLLPQAFGGTDSFVFWFVGKALNNGMVPYRDVFDHKGPLLYFINALGDLVGGFRGIGILEVIFWICFLIILRKTYKILKISKLNFSLTALLLPLLLSPILVAGNITEEYSLPFIAFGNYYLIKMFVDRKIKGRDSFLLGLSAAAVICLKSNFAVSFFSIALAVAYYTLIQNKDGKLFLKTVLLGIGGMAILLLPMGIYFYFNSALDDLYFCMFKFNMIYSAHKAPLSSIIVTIIKRVRWNHYLWIPSLISLVLLFQKKQKNTCLFVFLFLNTCLSVLSCVFSRSEFEHYWIIMIPNYVLLVAMLGANLGCSMKKNSYTVVFCWIIVFSLLFFVRLSILFHREATNKIKELQTFSTIIESNKNGASKTLVLGNGCSLYYFLKLNPDFKYIYQTPPVNYSSAIKDEFYQTIADRMYEYIIVRANNSQKDIITPFYTPVHSNKEYIIYAKKNTAIP